MNTPWNIEGFFAGDDLDLQPPDVTGVQPSDPLTKAWLTVKEDPDDLDVDAALQKIITTTLVGGVGHIGQDGGPSSGNGTASLFFQLSAAETAALGWVIRYFFDVQVKTASGKIYTAVVGSIKMERGYTDATT